MTRRPDVAGTLRCRPFHRYEFRICQRAPGDLSTQIWNLGE